MPPKYSCSICGKQFRRKKQHFNHVMSCSSSKKGNVTDNLETDHEQMQPNQYIGREYNYNPIPTANRHYRTGMPLPRLSKYSRSAI